MSRKISYVNKNFADFRSAVINYAKEYYPDIIDSLDDASVGSWLVDVIAGVSDSLSYHIDRAFQETSINGAQNTSSLYNIARNNGIKIPGPKGSVCEIKLTCTLPVNYESENEVFTSRTPNWVLAPIVKRGTKFSNGVVKFELDHDVDFGQAFDANGVPNRTIDFVKDFNGNITSFKISKYFVITAGETETFTKVITSKDVVPFMEVLLPYNDIMSIESVIVKEGTDHILEPSLYEFMMDTEYIPAEKSETEKDTYRFFEVDSLIQPYRWGSKLNSEYEPVVATYGYIDKEGNTIPTSYITRGEWKPLKQKFITEYTDKGYLKLIFGAGHKYKEVNIVGDDASYSKHLMSKVVNNDALGVLPKSNATMYIRYKRGGGSSSNIPSGSINKIDDLKIGFNDCRFNEELGSVINGIRQSFVVTNTSEAVSGRDMFTGDELRNYIKYNKGAQDRCVTLNDYRSRILQMPAAYGTPYRVGVTEENNKVMVYLLGLDYNGKLSSSIPEAFIKNLESYISEYRMINDFVEMKAGRIINLSFEVDCYINKNYNSADIVTLIIDKIKNYMAIDKRQMGDDIFLGDLEKEISMIDGVINIFGLRVYNEFGNAYSNTLTTQQTFSNTLCYGDTQGDVSLYRKEIDLNASDYILYSENDTMMEIKYPEKDIKVRVKLK